MAEEVCCFIEHGIRHPPAGGVVEASEALVAPTCAAGPCESIQVSLQEETGFKRKKRKRHVDVKG